VLEFVVRGVAHALAGSDKLAQVDELELPIAFLVGAFSHARFVDHWDLFLVYLGARRAAHATAFAVRETRRDRALFPQPPRALARDRGELRSCESERNECMQDERPHPKTAQLERSSPLKAEATQREAAAVTHVAIK
jgi:hypothetical protein